MIAPTLDQMLARGFMGRDFLLGIWASNPLSESQHAARLDSWICAPWRSSSSLPSLLGAYSFGCDFGLPPPLVSWDFIPLDPRAVTFPPGGGEHLDLGRLDSTLDAVVLFLPSLVWGLLYSRTNEHMSTLYSIGGTPIGYASATPLGDTRASIPPPPLSCRVPSCRVVCGWGGVVGGGGGAAATGGEMSPLAFSAAPGPPPTPSQPQVTPV